MLLYFYKKDLLNSLWASSENLPETIQTEDGNFYQKQETNYYYSKYLFLKQNGLFTSFPKYNNFDNEMTPQYIENAIINASNIVFEVTDDCNLKCEYCGYGSLYNDYDHRDGRKKSFNEIKIVLDYLFSFWNTYQTRSVKQSTFIGFYGGEPLLNMEAIRKTVSYIEQQNFPNREFSFLMTTNGLLLDRYMDFFAEKKFNLLISLDGNEKNNSYRINHSNQSSFKKVYQNLKELQLKYPDYFKTKVNLNAVLHDRNSMCQVQEFGSSEFDKNPLFGQLNNSGIHPNKIDLFKKMFYEFSEKELYSTNAEKLIKDRFINDPYVFRLARFIHRHCGNVFKEYNDFFSKASEKKLLPTGTCIPFTRKLYVTVNGKILACESIGHQYAIGQIKDNKISIDFDEISIKYNKYYKAIKKQCEVCYGADACPRCIFNIDDFDKVLKCNEFKNGKLFSENISVNISMLENYPYLYSKIMNEVVIS